MTNHCPVWRSPAPYWRRLQAAGADPQFAAPAILRFADDEFMEKLLAIMDEAPARLADFQVRHETWEKGFAEPTIPEDEHFRRPKPQFMRSLLRARQASKALVARGKAEPSSSPAYELKLYQPIHQRHYMVMTSLVCDVYGFPDRVIDTGSGERAGFVLRRLFPVPDASGIKNDAAKLPVLDPAKHDANGQPKGWSEHAFVPGPDGGTWFPVDDVLKRQSDEELLPLSPLNYLDATSARRRRLLGSVIPVARHDAYMMAARTDSVAQSDATGKQPDDLPLPSDARAALFMSKVIAPWRSLIEQAATMGAATQEAWNLDEEGKVTWDDSDRSDLTAIRRTFRDQIQSGSWYILLDFAELLATHAPDVWKVITEIGKSTDLDETNAKALCEWICSVELNTDLEKELGPNCASSLREALQAIKPRDALTADEIKNGLETANTPYLLSESDIPESPWPQFLFPLADCQYPNCLPTVDDVVALGVCINNYFSANKASKGEVAKPPAVARKGVDMREGWFVIRCCYERPECAPNCTVMSAPTMPFQMAGFFDPDAPARPIRIGLPIDTTPAGLRKFDKNTAFLISDVLCGQLKRVKSMTFGDLVLSVLPWPFHKDLPAGESKPCPTGQICSLSIPIITLCALVLLMIIVSLLDIIFHWLPFFRICFPIPGLKAKEGE